MSISREKVNGQDSNIEAGVDIFDIDNVYIDEDVRIGGGTVIGPCVRLEGSTVIGKNCKISRIAELQMPQSEMM